MNQFEDFCHKITKSYLESRKGTESQEGMMLMHMMKNDELTIAPVLDLTGNSPMDKAQGILNKFVPDMYLIAAETWVKIVRKGKEYEKFRKDYEFGDLANSPDREEKIAIVARTVDGKQNFSQLYDIIRDDKNKIIDFKIFGKEDPDWSSEKLT